MPDGYRLHPNDPTDALENIRPLSTYERSLIQTFPKDFTFLGSKTAQEQMIGNAVPVNLRAYVGKCILQYVNEHR